MTTGDNPTSGEEGAAGKIAAGGKQNQTAGASFSDKNKAAPTKPTSPAAPSNKAKEPTPTETLNDPPPTSSDESVLESRSPATSQTDTEAQLNLKLTGAARSKANAVPPLDDLLAARRDRRIIRNALAIGLGALALMFFFGLFYRLIFALSPESLAVASMPNGKALFAMSFSLGIMATICISLMLALVKISSEPESKDSESTGVGTVPSELFKAISDAFKSIRQ